MLKTVVTGGAGYVGVKLCKALLDAGHHVTAVDKFLFGYDSVLHLAQHENFEVVERDVRDEDRDYLKPADVVFHLGGLSGLPACESNPSSAVLINHRATADIGALLSPEQTIIYASTTSLYGAAGGEKCDEETPVTGENSNYARTKLLGERALMEHPRAISFRFATIFGVSPKMRIDLLPNDFAYQAVKERCLVLFRPASRRTFLHIDDAVRCYLMALDKTDQLIGQVFNVGHESLNHSKMEIAEAIKSQVDYTIITADEMEDLDIRDFYILFDKIGRLGFIPEITLEKGTQELVRLFQYYTPHSVVPRV